MKENCPSVMFLFSSKFYAKDESTAMKLSKKTVVRCEKFADAYQIHFHADCALFLEDYLFVRFVFQIQEPQDSILTKVPAVFNFAAFLKLTLINQEFFSE